MKPKQTKKKTIWFSLSFGARCRCNHQKTQAEFSLVIKTNDHWKTA